MNAKDDLTVISYIESFLLKRIEVYNKSYYIPSLARIIKRLETSNHIKSEELADIICLSPKQFSRVFLENIGIMPKTMTCIIRLHQAIRSIKSNMTLSMTQIAEECGYTDQSHMIKSFQKLTFHTPKELIASTNGLKPYSSYYLLPEFINKEHQSLFAPQETANTGFMNLNPRNITETRHFYFNN